MDTSALTKLLISEPETTELRTWLTAQSGQGEDAATSTLGRVELMRVVARYGQPGLDAIHLAAAAQIKRELTAFVTYDHRLLSGCREVGFVTASPGAVR